MPAQPLLPVIVNASGGTAARIGPLLEERLKAAFEKTGQAIALQLVAGADVAAAVRGALGLGRVVVGGGDGTLGSAADALAETGCELAVLPLGTRNHLARQLSVPLDLEGAARLAARGSATAIDLGRAGTRTFVNNASFGAYADVIQRRKGSRLPKQLANLIATASVFLRLRSRLFDLEIDGIREPIHTAQLFIGNNRYEIPAGHPTARQSLEDGLLSIFALAPIGRLATLRAGFALALGMPDMQRDFSVDRTARTVRIEGNGPIAFAIDGERHCAPLPLDIVTRPKALLVITPDDRQTATFRP